MEPLAAIYVGGGVVTLVIILIILFLLFGRGYPARPLARRLTCRPARRRP
jgi:hypothetical protein